MVGSSARKFAAGFITRAIAVYDSTPISEQLRRWVRHPIPWVIAALVCVVVLISGTLVSRQQTQISTHELSKVTATLGAGIQGSIDSSMSLIESFKETSGSDRSFTPRDWQTLTGILKQLKSTHLLAGAWYVETSALPIVAESAPVVISGRNRKKTPIFTQGPTPSVSSQKSYPAIRYSWIPEAELGADSALPDQFRQSIFEAAHLASAIGKPVFLPEKIMIGEDPALLVAVSSTCVSGSDSAVAGATACQGSLVFSLTLRPVLTRTSLVRLLPVQAQAALYDGLVPVPESLLGISAATARSAVGQPPTTATKTIPLSAGTRDLLLEVRLPELSNASLISGGSPGALFGLAVLAGIIALALSLATLTGCSCVTHQLSSLSRRLALKEYQLRSISDAAPFGILVITPRGECVFSNPGFQQLVGKTAQELDSAGWRSSVAPEQRQQFLGSWDEAITKAGRFEGVCPFIGPDGKSFVSDLRTIPIQEAELVIGHIVIVHDDAEIRRLRATAAAFEADSEKHKRTSAEGMQKISSLEQLAAQQANRITQLETQLSDLRRVNSENPRVQSGFLGQLRGELLSTLGSVLEVVGELHEQARLGDGKLAQLDSIRREAEAAVGIIDDLLDFSTIDSTKVPVQFIACSPLQVLDEVEGVLKPKAESQSISYGREAISAIPETLVTDRFRLKHALFKTIGRAISDTTSGGVKVVIKSELGSGAVRFEVIDTGHGLSPSTVSALQRGKVLSPITEEFAIGSIEDLANSKVVIEELGGTFTIESSVGRGTVVSFLVPQNTTKGKTPVKGSESKAHTRIILDHGGDLARRPKARRSSAKTKATVEPITESKTV